MCSRRLQTTKVTDVEDVEDAVRPHDSPPRQPPGFPKGKQLIERQDESGRRARNGPAIGSEKRLRRATQGVLDDEVDLLDRCGALSRRPDRDVDHLGKR